MYWLQLLTQLEAAIKRRPRGGRSEEGGVRVLQEQKKR